MVYVNGTSMEFQDPKNGATVVPYVWPYFGGISPYMGLIYGGYLQFRFLKWPLIVGKIMIYDGFMTLWICGLLMMVIGIHGQWLTESMVL